MLTMQKWKCSPGYKNYARGFTQKIQQGYFNSRKARNLFPPNAQEHPNSQIWMVKKEINPTRN